LTNEGVANVGRYGVPVVIAVVGLLATGVKLSDVTETPQNIAGVMSKWMWK
jgi:hypothetical protein